MVEAMALENPEMREEVLKWVLAHTDSIKDAQFQTFVKPLIACLTDKSKQIRDQVEKLIMLVMPLTGYNEFLNSTKDLKPAVQ